MSDKHENVRWLQSLFRVWHLQRAQGEKPAVRSCELARMCGVPQDIACRIRSIEDDYTQTCIRARLGGPTGALGRGRHGIRVLIQINNSNQIIENS